MAKDISLYPVSQVIAKVISNSGYTPLGFLLAAGQSDAESLLPSLESWLENGEGDMAIIAAIAAHDADEAAALYKAVEETAAMKAAGVDPVAFERAKRERRERDRFKPSLRAQGESRVPSAIACGADFRTIRIPEAILKLSLEEQLSKLPALMAEYRQKYNGTCPFFGKLVGFKFVRFDDYFQFDADGRLVQHVEEQVHHGIGLGGVSVEAE